MEMAGTATRINMIKGRAKDRSKASHNNPTEIDTSEYTAMRWKDECRTVYMVSPRGCFLSGGDSCNSDKNATPRMEHFAMTNNSAQKKLCLGGIMGSTATICGTDSRSGLIGRGCLRKVSSSVSCGMGNVVRRGILVRSLFGMSRNC